MFFPFGLNRFLFSPFYIMFVQKYEKESTYANFVNYASILQKIYFHFLFVYTIKSIYLCCMIKEVQKIRPVRMTEHLHKGAQKKAKSLGLKFSGYVKQLIEKDLKEN